MVPKIFKAGKSFKWLAAYLLHDADKKQTTERVAWTHTLNLASDDPGLAIDEMLWAYRYADELKRLSGVKAGGRRVDNPVKHFSLNWHPSEKPSREHMIETTENFLEHMGWQEHQALIVRHVDKAHAHVHVILNAVHPETGLVLNRSFEHRRAQVWAKTYEREHGLVFCEERLKSVAEREDAPTRESWQRVKGVMREHERAEIDRVAEDFDYFTRNEPGAAQDREWRVLKDFHRQQREQFFIKGKQEYRDVRNAVFRELRTEFRPVWREYYQAKRDGRNAGELKEMKAAILADQNALLDDRVKGAFAELQAERDIRYDVLKEAQGQEKAALARWQNEGHRAYDVLDRAYPNASLWQHLLNPDAPEPRASNAAELKSEFGRANAEITGEHDRGGDQSRQEPQRDGGREELSGGQDQPKVRDGVDAAMGILGAVAKIGERLFDGFFGGGETPKPQPPSDQGPRMSEEDQEKARRAAEEKARKETLDEEASKLAEYWQWRRERRRQRDRD